MPYSSRVGPIIASPIPVSGGNTLRAAISSCRTLYSAPLMPAPPYSFGQRGAIQPRSAHRAFQSLASSLSYISNASSKCTILLRILWGQLASSHSRVSFLNACRSVLTSLYPSYVCASYVCGSYVCASYVCASYVCASSNNGFVRLLLISFDRVSICVFSLSLLLPNTLFGDYISVVKR